MIYLIGIFFCVVFGIMLYLFSLVQTNKRGKFDVKSFTLDYDALMRHATELAKNQELFTGKASMSFLLSRMNENYRYISDTHRHLIELVSTDKRITGADEWLLDNFYVIEEQTKELRQNIQKKNFKRLPLIKQGQYTGYPRIFAIALEFVSHTDSTITQDSLIDFVTSYQKVSYLSDIEIWSLSTMLKIAIIENIRHLCEQINKTQSQYKQAEEAIEDIFNKNISISDGLSPFFKNSLLENSSLIENLFSKLKKRGREGSNGLNFIDVRLKKLNTNSERIINLEHQKQTARQVSMGNAVTSLRFILALNYTQIFEDLSQVEKILYNDPTDIYAKMDKKTKNLYRNNVDRIAKRFEMSEIEVALSAIELARNGKDDITRHIGYYLLETDLGRDNKKHKKTKQRLYALGSVILTLSISGLLSWYCYNISDSVALCILTLLITIIPASDIAINIINYIVAHTTKVTIIPRLELVDGVTEENATFVVISALLPNEKQAKSLISQLEIYYLANRQNNLYFGILSDFVDSKDEHLPNDEIILNTAISEIEKLNEKYNNKFFLFHRKRLYSKKNNSYMGWERKRGAIVEFSKLLRGDKNTSFSKIIGDINSLGEIKYVITLDADTKLPRDSAKELIGAMAHPLNTPIIKNGRVVSGYAIMQPRINVDIESASMSVFAQVFAGQGGIDAYSGAVSDVYQDLFGEGIFTGKGIFDVDVFHAILPSAIPENTVLSHDLLEGSYLRCALISDIELVDGFPWKYNSYTARQHRWIRGDWQLLPWLRGKIKNSSGEIVKNPLSLISKWKIADNLRRSLVPIFTLLIILLSFNFLPNDSTVWVGFAILTICFSLLISTIDWAINSGYRYLGQRCNATIIYGLRGVVYQVCLLFLFLPHYAYLTIDAAFRTIYRMTFSRKKMLEWVTAADAEKRLNSDVKSFYIRLLSNCVFAIILYFFTTKHIYLSIFLSTIWLIAPLVAYYISKPVIVNKHNVKDEDRKMLIELAQKTWQYFVDFTTVSDNYLAPDNYQENPANGIAHRTSPTNIGMQLTAVICARDLGFITTDEMVNMLEKVISTLEKLPMWNGHFYNWYNTKTLETLHPRYISTVDSGNLIGYMITLKQGLFEFKSENDRIENIIKRLNKIIDEMNFKPLYDEKRGLFSIGYNVEEEHLTKSYYDLLASEARQASFIAIAKGDVPKKHWFILGRTLVSRDGYRGLVSWTGTMFEYLMPLLLMKNVANTLFDETYHFLIRSQRKYGKLRNVPWGTSESGFNAFDIDLNYQYKAFGVPDLGLKRGLISDMVVAPYASVMALMVDYNNALTNLKQMQRLNIYGKYGFYEAIDYTPERILPNQKYSVVKSYMVHHLGMSLLALDNVLNDNILQKRFHSDVFIKATEELLSERVPTNVIISKENREKIAPLTPLVTEGEACVRDIETIDVNLPNVHILSNGKYSLILSDSGCGYGKCGDIMVTRFRNDLQNGIYGNFIFINNVTKNNWWTNTIAPAFNDKENYRALFSPHKADYFRKGNDGIDTTTEIIVSPEENSEIRKITIANHSNDDVVLEITSYTELVLACFCADVAHPAFSNLFIRTEYDEGTDAIIANRRPSIEGKKIQYAMHTISLNCEKIGKTEFETDRSKFIGRGRTILEPNIMTDGLEMSGSTGSVLDPIMSLRFKIKIEKGKVSSFAFITSYCENRDDAIQVAHKYKNYSNIERAFEMSWTRSQIENKYLGINAKLEKCAYDMYANMTYILPYRKSLSNYIENNKLGQRSLWSIGISGDNPIITLRVYSNNDLDMVRDILVIHELWRIKGVPVDLAIISEDESSYNQPLMTEIREIVSISHIRELVGISGGVFIIDGALQSEEIKTLLYSVSKIVLNSNLGDISSQLEFEKGTNLLPYTNFTKTDYEYSSDIPIENVEYYNGFGGFTKDEYIIKLSGNNVTPLPWINVIANNDFGFIVSESGGGYIWCNNSRENKLTPWTNDTVSDTPHESIYIRDDVNGAIWTATGAPIRTHNDYVIRHGFGYSIFETINQGISSKLTMFVPVNDKVKINILELENKTELDRNISITYYTNLILGSVELDTKPYIEISKDNNTIIAKNSYNQDYLNQRVYVSSSENIETYTADKREFFGENRGKQIPNGLLRDGFTKTLGSGFDSCITIQNKIRLKPNESKKVVLILGCDNTILKYLDIKTANTELEKAKKYWSKILGTVKVTTPDHSMNLMVNGWLLYQTLCCRIFARSAFYQSGGAFGFRDQLQDVLSLLHIDSDYAKKQIIRSSAHQYKEGDVQHWWHQIENDTNFAADKGIRTKFSDDLLWLPYVVAEYIKVTGDRDILKIETPFIEDEMLRDHEDERYAVPKTSNESGSIYEHCLRAINKSLNFGAHGIPLMGSGDWNDGMNTVGNKGSGESVWLGWFLYDILVKFINICKENDDISTANKFEEIITELANNLNENAWDGAWYRRAYFDDGKPLGSNENTECKIDAIAQAWSVISKAGRDDYKKQAMDSLFKYLVNKEEGIIKLLTPPFDNGDLSPGYIKGYVPGVRENGGQYTHAASWVILAFAELRMGDIAGELFALINPINHSRTQIEAARYKVEPYVVSADVYSMPPNVGRGGWSWYTGASGWLYRVALENILGFKKVEDKLIINPCIPHSWKEYTVEYIYKQTKYIIKIKNENGTDVSNEIILVDDKKTHKIEIVL